jgi:hypothetical protein
MAHFESLHSRLMPLGGVLDDSCPDHIQVHVDDTLNEVAICLHCGYMIAVFPERAFSASPLTRFIKNRPLRKKFGPAHPCPCGKGTLDCRQKRAGMLPQGFHGSFHLWIDKARECGDPISEAEYSSVQEARVVPGLEKDIDRHISSTL